MRIHGRKLKEPFVPLELSRTDDDASAEVVLIVGTGPAGLFAACELLRHGIKPRGSTIRG
jgi:ribulose 1,5-bisphosphate synthetase/thiazole synthase